MKPWRAKLAALVILFVLGTFAGQIRGVLDTVRGGVERGARIGAEIRSTVTTIQQVDTSILEAQIADLQARLATGTATPEQVESLTTLVARLRASAGPPGTPGPAGPSGPPGTSAEGGAPSTTTTSSSAPDGTTTSSRPATTTTTRSRPPTPTTTRCVVNAGRLAKVGCT